MIINLIMGIILLLLLKVAYMNQRKYKVIAIILFAIVFISGGFISLDWYGFYIGLAEYNASLYSYIAKSIILLLSIFLVFLIGKDGLNKKDTFLLRLVYIFIILADISFILFKEPYMGIGLFSIVQICLILRNTLAIKDNYKGDNSYRLKTSLFINLILGTIFLIINFLRIINGLIDRPILLVFMLSYSLLISMSLWTSLANILLGIFPKVNGALAVMGMIFFILCDLHVGLSLSLNHGASKSIAQNLIWVFYTPALTLVALSGYNLKSYQR